MSRSTDHSAGNELVVIAQWVGLLCVLIIEHYIVGAVGSLPERLGNVSPGNGEPLKAGEGPDCPRTGRNRSGICKKLRNKAKKSFVVSEGRRMALAVAPPSYWRREPSAASSANRLSGY